MREQINAFISGGVGGICLVLVGHPFDLIKVRLQTSHAHSGMMDMVAKIIKHDGLKGLYRGVSAPLLGVTPIFAVCFWGYDVGLYLYDRATRNTNNNSRSSHDDVRCMTAGAFSALPTTLIMAPAERVKVLMQTSSSNATFSQAVKMAWREGGIRSLYKGSVATLFRDVPGSIAYFGVYEVAKRKLKGDSPRVNPLAIMLAGGLAGMANWAVAIPVDVVKSRWQSAPPGAYSSTINVFTRLIKEEGPSALFKGFLPVMMRAFPANAACFFGMEASKKALEGIW